MQGAKALLEDNTVTTMQRFFNPGISEILDMWTLVLFKYYFKNVDVLGKGGGILDPTTNFNASCSTMIKFDALIEFDKFFSKSPEKLKTIIILTSLRDHNVIPCFSFPYHLKYFDRFD